MSFRLTPTGLVGHGRRLACSIGRGGLTATKREGDGATPVGTWHITGLLYRPDRLARPAAWARPIGLTDLWSDDPKDPLYNRHVKSPHSFSHERLRRADPLYDIVVTTDWNAAAVPEHGSAIFIHRWRRRGMPTEGCIAMAPDDLRWFARNAAPGTRIVVG